MNALIDSLLSLHARYPGIVTLTAAGFKATAVFSMAWFMVQTLAHRSARARNWAWRIGLAMMLLLACWMVRPAPMQNMGLTIDLVDRTLVKQEPPLTEVQLNSPTESPSTADEAKTITVRLHPTAPMSAAAAKKLPAAPGWNVWLRRIDDRVLLVWALGVVLFVMWKLGRHLAGRAWLSARSETPSPAMKALCPEGLECRVSARVSSPLIIGWLKPVVWLPAEAAGWDELKLRAAFQHERAHHVRRDTLWQTIGTLAACVWWWLPLSWIALRKMKAEAEHAADDVTVTQSLTVPDYAEALVQIAHGVVARPRAGIAMAEHCDLEHRVRSLLRDNPWRDKLGALASTLMVIMMMGMSTVVLVGCKRQPQQFISLAKLVAGGRMVASPNGGPAYVDYLQDFYGTIIETLESAEMRRHALERVRALNPDLKESDVDVKVTQNKGSAIFNVAAIGREPKFTRVFLDALLDEFRAFREQIREQQRNKAVTSMAEDVVRRELALKEKAEKLATFKRNYNVVVLTNGQNQAVEFLKQVRSEMNRLNLQLSDINLAQKDLETSLEERRRSAEIATGATPPADGVFVRDSSSGFTRLESDYFAAKRELTDARVDIEVQTESKMPDPIKLEEAQRRKTKQEKLLKVYAQEITESLKSQKADIERRLSVLDKKAEEFTQQAIETGAKAAEFDRLTKDFEDSDKAYKEMFDLVHRFQVNEDMQGDYISIMERASAAVEDVQPWWKF